MAEPFQFDGVVDTPEPGARPRSDQDLVKDIGAIFRGEAGDDIREDAAVIEDVSGDADAYEGGDAEHDSEIEPEGGDAEPPQYLAELAEIASLKADELYSLRVPMGDGIDPMTIGELKDEAKKVQGLAGDRQALDDERAEFANDMIRARQELTEIVRLFPGEIPPAVVEAAQQQYAATLERERVAREQVMPQWADQQVWGQAQSQIADLMQTYGFSRADVEVGTTDHRLLKALYDFSELKRRVADAEENATKLVRRTRRKRNQRTTDTARNQREASLDKARNGTTADKVRGVQAILKGANSGNV